MREKKDQTKQRHELVGCNKIHKSAGTLVGKQVVGQLEHVNGGLGECFSQERNVLVSKLGVVERHHLEKTASFKTRNQKKKQAAHVDVFQERKQSRDSSQSV